MSKKILFVIAGPRLKGASAFAARTAAEGAGQGGADVEIVELPKLPHVQSMGVHQLHALSDFPGIPVRPQ